MATFNYGDDDYLAKLNDLASIGMPRMLQDRQDPDSVPGPILVDRHLYFEDNGQVADVTASMTFTFDVGCVQDGWAFFVHVKTGTATINLAPLGITFMDGVASKTVTAGNAAIISCNGSQFRIFRFSAT